MRRERGFAMMWAMFLVVLVGALGAVVLERDLTTQKESQVDLAALRAFHAAEGGLERARHALARDPRWQGGAFEVGPSHVIVKVKRPDAKTWHVTSTATPGSARIEAVLESSAGLPTVRTWNRVQ